MKNGQVDFEHLKKTVHTAVHFLDNVIDMSDYKLPEIKKVVMENRKIGLGIMGFADLLLQLEIPYNSAEGVKSGESLMMFIQKEAHSASQELGRTRGSFPNFKDSIFAKQGRKTMRNATVTTIAPAGTLSMIVDASSGIEPLYALVYTKHVLDGSELLYVNRHFEAELKKHGLNSRELTHQIARTGSIREIQDIPDEMKKLFVVAADIAPEWHIRMQAAFQKNTDNAVSKTINFPANATIEDVKKICLLAYKTGCKGVSIHRDRSRQSQVLTRLNYSMDEEEINENQIQLPFIEISRHQKNVKKIEEVKLPPIQA
jgi:ribonucleoside-diphosphate reductase alpha chain